MSHQSQLRKINRKARVLMKEAREQEKWKADMGVLQSRAKRKSAVY